ncbi:hypothetical protein ABK040_005291 [Willaertia magna]
MDKKSDIKPEPHRRDSHSLAPVNYYDAPTFTRENPNAPLIPNDPETVSVGLIVQTVVNREKGSLSPEDLKSAKRSDQDLI